MNERERPREPLRVEVGPELRFDRGPSAGLVLDGANASAEIDAHAGPLRIELLGRAVLRGLCVRSEDGAASRAVAAAATSIGSRRTLVCAGRQVVERVVLPPRLAGAIVEYQVGAPTRLTLEWVVPAAPAAVSVDSDAGRISATVVADPPLLAVFDVDPAPLHVTLEETAAPDAVRVRAELAIDGLARLRAAAAPAAAPPGETARDVLDRLGDGAASCRSRAGRVRRALRERLAVRTPDDELNDVLAWATHTLDADRIGGMLRVLGPGTACRAALAALACGEREPARRLLGATDILDAAGAPGLVLAASYLAWTGDPAPVRDAWPDILRAARTADPRFRTSAVLEALEAAAVSLADSPAAAELRALRVDEAGRQVAGPPPSGSRGVPDDAERESKDLSAFASRAVLGLVEHVLGAEPDAVRHRLRLAPCLPDSWRRLEVERLTVGDAAVALRVEVEVEGATGVSVRLELEQTTGAVPLSAVMEPRVPGTELRAVSIDGHAARLEPGRDGRFIVAPFQVVLDHARQILLRATRDAR